jgi:hypothetical protein
MARRPTSHHTASVFVTAVAGVFLLLAALGPAGFQLCRAQTFHYSRGWTNGKRTSSLPAAVAHRTVESDHQHSHRQQPRNDPIIAGGEAWPPSVDGFVNPAPWLLMGQEGGGRRPLDQQVDGNEARKLLTGNPRARTAAAEKPSSDALDFLDILEAKMAAKDVSKVDRYCRSDFSTSLN